MPTPDFLFLDFDGVLHVPGRGLPFEYLPELEAALGAFAEVKVVISSSWQDHYRETEIVDFLGPVADRFAGLTRHAEPDEIFARALQAEEEVLKLPAVDRFRKCGHRDLTGPGLRQRAIELWMRRRAAPGQTWLALDDAAWNFDEGCRQAVIVDLVSKPVDKEFEKLRSALLDFHSVAPIEDPFFNRWRTLTSSGQDSG